MADDKTLRPLQPDASRTSGSSASVSSGPSRSAGQGDPLAELARLIGQDDLFEEMRRDAARAAPPAPAMSASSSPPPRPASPPLRPSAAPRGSYNPLADLAASAPRRRTLDDDAPATSGSAGLERSLSSFRQPLSSQAAEAPMRRASPAYRAPEPAPYVPAEPAYAPTRAQQSSAADARHQAQHSEPAHYAEEPHYPQHQEAAGSYADPGYDPATDYPYDDEHYADAPPVEPRRRGRLMMVAAVVGIAAVGTAGAFAYRAMSSGDGSQPPVIKANTSPAKVAGAPSTRDAGRTTYDRNDRTTPERMQSREEQPMQLAEVRGSRGGSGVTGSVPGASAASSVTAFAPSAGASPIPSQTSSGEPKRVRTIPIRPDGSVAPESAVRSQNTGSIGRTAAVTPGTATRTPATRNAPVVASAPASAPDVSRLPAGSHVVQVASQKTEEDAQASFRALQAKYPAVLGNRQPLIRKTELGDRGTFYRVQVGPFASAEQANEVCGTLKAAGGQCIVQRN